MRIIAFVTDGPTVCGILVHLGEPGPNSFGLGVQCSVSKSRSLATESYREPPLRA
jgi:hypothetical protein